MLKELAHLVPTMKNRFKIEFHGKLSKEAKDAMARNVVNFRIDFAAKTLAFDIQQPATWTELAVVIADFTAEPSRIRAILFEGNGISLGYMQFDGLKTVQHAFELDYATFAVAEHKIVLSYTSVISDR